MSESSIEKVVMSHRHLPKEQQMAYVEECDAVMTGVLGNFAMFAGAAMLTAKAAFIDTVMRARRKHVVKALAARAENKACPCGDPNCPALDDWYYEDPI